MQNVQGFFFLRQQARLQEIANDKSVYAVALSCWHNFTD